MDRPQAGTGGVVWGGGREGERAAGGRTRQLVWPTVVLVVVNSPEIDGLSARHSVLGNYVHVCN